MEDAPSMEEITTRLATKEDIPVLLEMIRSLAEYEQISDEVRIDGNTLQEILCAGNPIAHGLLALLNGKPVGYALLVPVLYVKRVQRKLIVEDVYVDPAHRSRKIGEYLMSAALAFARERNYFKLEWGVFNWNEGAQRFYQRIGAVPGTSWTGYQLVVE